VQARRIRPDTGYLDRRRLAAAGLSAVLPGLGQLFNGRRQLAAIFLVPSLVLLGVALLIALTQSPTRLVAWLADPTVLGTVLTLNLVVLVWRLLAAGQAFLDTRWHGPTGRAGIIGLVLIGLLVILPHGVAYRYGTALGDTFSRVFSGAALGTTGRPDDERGGAGAVGNERINVLLIGIDKLPWRTATLTDAMMVISLDPVGDTVSMLSLPRDLIGVPLGNGDVYGPKINSLMSYADRHEDEFPDGGVAALEDAVGALLDIHIDYYAKIDFYGFVDLVDAVGGVDIDVKDGFTDNDYYNFGKRQTWSITPGVHHLDGVDALAYARARKGLGESDFTRAGRQQQVLVALRDQVTKDGSLLWKLPELLDLAGNLLTTDIPVERLPALAAIGDDIGDKAITRAVIRHPLVKSKSTKYGSSLIPDVEAIQAVAHKLFPPPGGTPIPWPTPKPTPTPEATASP
jgi:polyisoprenyl-teichoic acid--peptidoglycan teichoic acid transferase